MEIRDSEQLLKDVYSQERVTLCCGQHFYTGEGAQPPTPGCKDCAQVQLMYIFAHKKGDKRAALDELEAIVRALCELEDEGLFDYKSTKPEITISRGQ